MAKCPNCGAEDCDGKRCLEDWPGLAPGLTERVCPECHFRHDEDEDHPVPVLTPEEEHEMEQSRRESIRREGIEVIAHDYLENIEHEQGKQTETRKDGGFVKGTMDRGEFRFPKILDWIRQHMKPLR